MLHGLAFLFFYECKAKNEPEDRTDQNKSKKHLNPSGSRIIINGLYPAEKVQ